MNIKIHKYNYKYINIYTAKRSYKIYTDVNMIYICVYCSIIFVSIRYCYVFGININI